MSPDERLGRYIVGCFLFGAIVAAANFAVDLFFAHLQIVTATTVLNDLIIGTAAAVLAFFWISRQAREHLREMFTGRLMEEAIHNERKRMALELHDTACQASTGAVLHLECARASLGGNPAAQEHVYRALELVRGSMNDMRCALWDLYPEELQNVDLKRAIEYLVKDLTAGSPLQVQLSLGGTIRRLPPETEKELLRISREALSNVVRHAKASEVQIELFLDTQRARLCVKDDGQGFPQEQHVDGFGLTSMQDRTRALGGVCTIHSEPGHGTEVYASIPIPPAMN
jgi:signal transduction histidine kinase